MKLKEINRENVKLSSHVESEVGEKDLKDIARELEKIVENRND